MQTEFSASRLTIGKLAHAAGVGIEAIRFYQRRGLLDTPSTNTGYRTYGDQHVERLRFVKRAQAVGFSLDEIAELLQLNDSRDHQQARALARSKIADIEVRINDLQSIAAALRHLVHKCENGNDGTPCPIIRMALAPAGNTER